MSSVGKESACNAGHPGLIPGSRSAGEGIGYPLQYSWASLVAQLVKNLPAVRETCVQSLDWEDSLEKGRLPIPILWPRVFQGLYSPWGLKESDITERLSLRCTYKRICCARFTKLKLINISIVSQSYHFFLFWPV